VLSHCSSFRSIGAAALALAFVVVGISMVTAGQSTARDQEKPAKPPVQPQKEKVAVGLPAPGFELRDTDGKLHRLIQHRDHVVVLEWFNGACAEVRHQHTDGTMKGVVREFEDDDVVWFAIDSTPPAETGSAREALVKAKTELGITFPILVDDRGTVAELYGVKRTPTIFVIDEEGALRYMGAIDNAPNGKLPKDAKMVNYLQSALQSVLYGSELPTSKTEAYGCPIPPKGAG
jgi:peroxiredoxin